MGSISYEHRVVALRDGSLRHQLLRRDQAGGSIEVVADIDRIHAWEIVCSLIQQVQDAVPWGWAEYPAREHTYAFPKPGERNGHPWTAAEVHLIGVLRDQSWSVQDIALRVGRSKRAVIQKFYKMELLRSAKTTPPVTEENQ